MKVFVAIAVIAFVAAETMALTPEQHAQAEEKVKKCAQTHEITSEELSKIKGGDFSNTEEKIKCFANCFLESVGFLKDGVLQEDVVVEKLSKSGNAEQVKKIVDSCKGLKGTNNCDTAFKLYTCYAEKKAAPIS